MNKQVVDFLTYDRNNITWFAFNFVLILLPPCLMFLLPNDDPNYKLNDEIDGASYLTVMYIIWIMHVF